LTVSQVADPCEQIVTLTQGLLIYPMEFAGSQSEPFTVMGITLAVSVAVPPVTVKVADPETLPEVAEIVVVAAAAVTTVALRDVAKPVVLMVATFGSDELQVTEAVMSAVDASEYEPMAVYCNVVLVGILASAGVTVIDTSLGAVTVRVAEFEVMLPNEAVIVAVPGTIGEAKPFEPSWLLMVATVVVEEFQVTAIVTSCIELSE